eukprot:s3584_g1.t1
MLEDLGFLMEVACRTWPAVFMFLRWGADVILLQALVKQDRTEYSLFRLACRTIDTVRNVYLLAFMYLVLFTGLFSNTLRILLGFSKTFAAMPPASPVGDTGQTPDSEEVAEDLKGGSRRLCGFSLKSHVRGARCLKHMAAVSRQRPAAGEALRQRLAAQADAALAEGPDNPLRVLLSQPEGTREDAKSRLEAAERLLLERPKPKALEDKDVPDGVKLPPARKAHDKHVGDLDVFLGLVKKRPKEFEMDIEARRDCDFLELLGPLFLGKIRVSISYKLSIWRSCVYSTMMYGLSTCGINGDQVRELQRAIMKHVRAIVNNQAHLTGDTHETIVAKYSIPKADEDLQQELLRAAERQKANLDWMYDAKMARAPLLQATAVL